MDDSAPFEGITNFRDFGGFSVQGGGRVRRGRLLRSAHLGAATDADLERLQAMPLSVIVDLRRSTERAKQPGRRPPGFAGTVIECDDGDLGEAPHLTFLAQGEPSPEAVEAFLLDYYREAPFQPRHRRLFTDAFAVLGRAPGAMLVHCAAGKDRTGLLAALIRTALGGRAEDTAADFLATNDQTLTPERLALGRASVQAITGAAPSDVTLRAFLGVWPHHLEAAFAAIEARCGSAEAYLQSLGVDAARRAELADALVA